MKKMRTSGTILIAIVLTCVGPLLAQFPETKAPAATTVPPPQPAESLPRPDFRFKQQFGVQAKTSGNIFAISITYLDLLPPKPKK